MNELNESAAEKTVIRGRSAEGEPAVFAGEEAVEEAGEFDGVGDLLEAEDRPGEVLEGCLVDLEAVGDRQEVAVGAVLGQESEEPFQARLLPEADDVDVDVDAGGLVR